MQQEDWDELRDQMDSPYGRMSLQCDQFKVSLVQVIDTKARKWATEVFVDGTQKGAWFMSEVDGEPLHEEQRRFLRKTEKSLYSKAEQALHKKVFGKKSAAELAAKRLVRWETSWSNFNSLKAQLEANNTRIERLH
ncbi:hypothetical protein [Pseudomonas juntendi]|uniref:Uncharacterized protein n=1 Tax=Pseudomonas juntendi TaxID=2666183 RepID=A0A7W2LZ70_9PSED|nr:hypothetical protein [Pseudomonas juntendi]MBA6130811.1 hypothetical protein [Pseudomonas juntendi]MBA6149775.1 hypothetical protein [Pseudomonas juntendi]